MVRLSECLLKKNYVNDQIYPCVSVKRNELNFVIIIVYVNYSNLIGTPEEFQKIVEYLKIEFEIKNIRKIKICLDLQIEHLEK